MNELTAFIAILMYTGISMIILIIVGRRSTTTMIAVIIFWVAFITAIGLGIEAACVDNTWSQLCT
jgi:hypothetical protein